MATKVAETVDVEEVLDIIDKSMERLKSLYEQYFLGLQKQAPAHLHNDVDRRIRELMQVQIRNTGLRYRYATLQQKFGSYNSYWRRTLRQIEQGTYIRQLSKISRKAAESGEEIPEEILAAMPKRMREQVKRDREQALAVAARRGATGSDVDVDLDGVDDAAAPIHAPQAVRNPVRKHQHVLSEADGDLDIDAFFASVSDDTSPDAKAYVPEHDDEPTGLTAPPKPPARPSAPPAHRAASAVGPAPAQQRPGLPPQRQSQPMPVQPPQRNSQPMPAQSPQRNSQSMPPQPPERPSRPTQPPPMPPPRQSQPIPTQPPQGQRFVPPQRAGTVPGVSPMAPSQVTRPNPISPGSSQQRPQAPVESMQGPFPRAPAQRPEAPPPRPTPRPEPAPPMRPPPGMNDADVNALYAKYVKAKQAVGEDAGPGAYGKLLKTINSQAPKIMEQYKAKGVEFSVVVKDNQVIIKAKPKP